VAAGIPAKATKPIGGTSSEFWIEANGPYYQELAQRHAASVTAAQPEPLDDGDAA
jgi:hypothetical protein